MNPVLAFAIPKLCGVSTMSSIFSSICSGVSVCQLSLKEVAVLRPLPILISHLVLDYRQQESQR
jgi:hypothetical protein